MVRLPGARLLALIASGILAGCGGGGGGSSAPPPPPVNTTPPTASISTIAPAQRVTSQAVTFTGTGTTPVTNGVLTYAWNFGDGSTATGASVTHTYAARGDYTVTLTVRDSGNLSTVVTQLITVVAPPATPTITVDDFSVTPNSAIAVTAAATDPQGGALTYAWEFGDGGTASGASATHAYATEGSFVVRVTATNALGLSSTASTSPVFVAWLPMTRPTLILLNDGHFLGHTLFAWSAFLEPNGLAYTLDYSFGDGTTTRTTDPMQQVTHSYATPGTYTVRLTATNSVGRTVEATGTVNVQPPSAQPVASDNILAPYCAGSFCGAATATSYQGSGVGIWRYHNATNADATINISISGVTARSPATLLFSNGRTTAAASVPGAGTQAPAASKALLPARADPSRDHGHERVLEANRRMAANLPRRADMPAAPVRKNSRTLAHAAVPVGTTRQWNEFFFAGQTSTVVAAATCTFSTGRNGVIWVDAGQLQRGEIAPARITGLTDVLCGPNGAYEQLVARHGDVWGPAPASLVQDTATLQDLHIVVAGAPQSANYNGYFSAANLNSTATDPGSNAAISVVLNGWVFANYPIDDPSTRNTLIHELKHLINYYQRAIVRGSYHAAWLEETSAMLAEDLVSPRVQRYSRTEARVSGYVYSGGGIGYLGWTHPEGNSYNQGGAFGTFLHRRYGASLDSELITMCNDTGLPDSSYQCVHDYIIRHGGLGFEDEFARMGASALGSFPRSSGPLGFGFPGMLVDGSPLEPVGSTVLPGSQLDTPRALNGVFGATMHTYSREFIAAGQTTYTRNNVVVPAGTTLLLVIAEPYD
jgi:PKD repeat protein